MPNRTNGARCTKKEVLKNSPDDTNRCWLLQGRHWTTRGQWSGRWVWKRGMTFCTGSFPWSKNFPWSCQVALTTLVTAIGRMATWSTVSSPVGPVGLRAGDEPGSTEAERFLQVFRPVDCVAGYIWTKNLISSQFSWAAARPLGILAL